MYVLHYTLSIHEILIYKLKTGYVVCYLPRIVVENIATPGGLKNNWLHKIGC